MPGIGSTDLSFWLLLVLIVALVVLYASYRRRDRRRREEEAEGPAVSRETDSSDMRTRDTE